MASQLHHFIQAESHLAQASHLMTTCTDHTRDATLFEASVIVAMAQVHATLATASGTYPGEGE